MEYKKYQHVCRMGTSDVEGLLDGEVYVFSKIDGTNGTLFLGDNGLVHGGSRRRELNDFQDNQGFMANFIKIKDLLIILLNIHLIDYLVNI